MSEIWIIVGGLAVVVGLVATNALFVATEFAFVGARRSRIEFLAKGGRGRARLLLASLKELDSYIATTQLGITLASIGLGWVGEPILAGLVEPPAEAVLGGWVAIGAAHAVASIIAFALITAVLIVFGELAPKSLALARAESVALAVAWPITAFRMALRPFVWAMNRASRTVVHALGVEFDSSHQTRLDPEELGIVIEASARAGLLSTSELLFARRAIQFSTIQADQVMVPRTEVIAIEADSSLEGVLSAVERSPHTRYPVCRGNLDDVIGVVETKSLVSLLRSGEDAWHEVIRPATAIPESVSVEVALAEMRAREAKLLVLIDEHGGTSGILTAGELLQRLLGRWLSGVEGEEEPIRPLSSGHYLLSGLALVGDVEDVTGLSLAGEDYDTVGGLVMARMGRIPRVGDRFQTGGWEFRVTAMDERRVERVLAIPRTGEGAT
ncbi:MAG: hemolysin family protein [Dehalococcoidia bacterium]